MGALGLAGKMLTGPTLIAMTTVATVSDKLSEATGGLLVALTVLVHAYVAERTRRQSKRTEQTSAVIQTAEDLNAAELRRLREEREVIVQRTDAQLAEKDEAIKRLSRRVDELLALAAASAVAVALGSGQAGARGARGPRGRRGGRRGIIL